MRVTDGKRRRVATLAGALVFGALAAGVPAADAHHTSGSKSVGVVVGPTPVIPITVCVDAECDTTPVSAPALGGTLDVAWAGHSNREPTATEIGCGKALGNAILVETYGGTFGFDVGFTPAGLPRQGLDRFETFGPRKVTVLACVE